MQKNEKSNNKIDKNYLRNTNNKIQTFPTTSSNYKTNIQTNEVNKNFEAISTLPAFTMFKGFYNKKFNLTSYKNERENSRSRSRSPERRIEPHKIRGNGIPDDALDRISFFGTIFKDPSFQKYYASRPKKKTSKFEDICNYIINYRKNHSELESVMMAFYFVCHEIKYDSSFFERNNNKENQNPNNNNINKNNIKNFKK